MPVAAVRSGLADNPNPVDDLHGLLRVKVPLADHEAESLYQIAQIVVRDECLRTMQPVVEPDKRVHLYVMSLQRRFVEEKLEQLGLAGKLVIDSD